MSRKLILALVLVFVPVSAAVVTTTTGCTNIAKKHAMVPALKLAADHALEKDARAGVETLPVDQRQTAARTVSEFFSIIRSGNEGLIRSRAMQFWGRVKELIELGIVDGKARKEFGDVGERERRESLANFDDNLRAFLNRTTVTD